MNGANGSVEDCAAFHAATNHKGQPTVLLIKTVKGYGMGKAGEGKNTVHQTKKLSDEDAFFAVDNTVPSLSGTIEYTDTFVGGSSAKTPGSSKLVLNLDAYQLTKQQILSLHKLLLFIVGPFNDE